MPGSAGMALALLIALSVVLSVAVLGALLLRRQARRGEDRLGGARGRIEVLRDLCAPGSAVACPQSIVQLALNAIRRGVDSPLAVAFLTATDGSELVVADPGPLESEVAEMLRSGVDGPHPRPAFLTGDHTAGEGGSGPHPRSLPGGEGGSGPHLCPLPEGERVGRSHSSLVTVQRVKLAPVTRESTGILAAVHLGSLGDGAIVVVEPQPGNGVDQHVSALVAAAVPVWQLALEQTRCCADATRADSWSSLAVLHGVSHNLKTPLTAIKVSAGLLSDRTRRRQRAHHEDDERLVESIVRNGERLSRMVDQLLDLVRLESGAATLRYERVDLREPLHDALSHVRTELPDGSPNLTLDLRTAEPIVWADRRRIRQAIECALAVMASQAPTGSTVRLTVAREQEEIVISALVDVPHPRPLPEGEGETGMAHNQPGPQADGGHSLRLALARRIVALHRGRIASSEEGWPPAIDIALPAFGKTAGG